MTDGTVQHVTEARVLAGRDRLDEALRVAGLGGTHVWTVVTAHLVVDPASIGPDMLLDADSIVSIAPVCYVCEQPFEPRLVRRRCPGDPG